MYTNILLLGLSVLFNSIFLCLWKTSNIFYLHFIYLIIFLRCTTTDSVLHAQQAQQAQQIHIL